MKYIDEVVSGTATSDGAGVDINRVIGTPKIDHIDPFLLLDEFRNEDPGAYIAGFPPHPHRGFETVTYMLHGSMRHEDSTGQSGLLSDGAVQWMTAGSGIIHSEMPEQTEGMMWGYQLWVNLPASKKMTAPAYQDIPAVNIPEVATDKLLVRVIAGEYDGISGAAKTMTNVSYLDVHLDSDGLFTIPLPDDWNGFVYVYQGQVTAGDSRNEKIIVPQQSMGIISGEGDLELSALDGDVRFLLLAGEPIGEPVARLGPFVMNTREELFKASDDYRRGKLTERPS
jgi:quercetin 2,3-dioxygenase